MTFPYQLIDLTHTLDESIPTWNASCGFNHDIHIDYIDCKDEYKFRVMKVKMHAGIGTHMDAPSHCISGGKFIHDFDINTLLMPCFVIDVVDKCHELYSLTAQDILDFENKYEKITNSSCVMVKTGWSKYWNEPLKYHNNHVFPSVSSEATELLIERGVKAIAVETLSPDRPKDGFKVHNLFLSAGNIIVENVANLDSMPLIGGLVMIIPIKIKNGTEAPIRLIGLINN